MYQELSWWTGGTPLTSGRNLSLSSQLKVVRQISDLTPQQAAKLRETYKEMFERDLVSDIDAKLSLGRAAALKAWLVAFKPQELAQLMVDHIDATVSDDPQVLVDIMTNLSFDQRETVAEEFEKLSGGKSVLKKLQEDYAVYDYVTPVKPFLSGQDIQGLTEAYQLYALMKGAGFNDNVLILETLQRGSASPAEIARVFEAYYIKPWGKTSLLDVLVAETDETTVAAARRLIAGGAAR